MCILAHTGRGVTEEQPLMYGNVDERETAHIEDCCRMACLIEASARKPGNVHPAASFDDLCYNDFVASSDAVAPILARTRRWGVGQTVYQAIEETQRLVGRNTNLGTVLLLAPLAAVDLRVILADGIECVLERLTRDDAGDVYRAIRAASPGGMGEVVEQDVTCEPTETLLDVMRRAAGRDSIAAQYASGFETVLNVGVPILQAWGNFSTTWEAAVINLQLRLMADVPDTLIARKCGREVAQVAAALASNVLEAGWPETRSGDRKLVQLDRWLRGDGHRRNPGTTADLVAACLFAGFRDRRIEIPPRECIVIGHKNS